jgi:hypothetical protein
VSKKKIVLLILLILFLLPEIGDYSFMFDDNPYAWRFWNIWYRESRWRYGEKEGEWLCYDMLPQPHYRLSYESLFVDFGFRWDYCDDWTWWVDDSVSLFLGIEYWGWETDIYLPLFWIMISDKDVSISLLGQSIND